MELKKELSFSIAARCRGLLLLLLLSSSPSRTSCSDLGRNGSPGNQQEVDMAPAAAWRSQSDLQTSSRLSEEAASGTESTNYVMPHDNSVTVMMSRDVRPTVQPSITGHMISDINSEFVPSPSQSLESLALSHMITTESLYRPSNGHVMSHYITTESKSHPSASLGGHVTSHDTTMSADAQVSEPFLIEITDPGTSSSSASESVTMATTSAVRQSSTSDALRSSSIPQSADSTPKPTPVSSNLVPESSPFLKPPLSTHSMVISNPVPVPSHMASLWTELVPSPNSSALPLLSMGPTGPPTGPTGSTGPPGGGVGFNYKLILYVVPPLAVVMLCMVCVTVLLCCRKYRRLYRYRQHLVPLTDMDGSDSDEDSEDGREPSFQVHSTSMSSKPILAFDEDDDR